MVGQDRDEAVSKMEPLLISEGSRHRSELADLALVLTAKSAGLKKSLPPKISEALATLVRAMNCYYSNLIEGHRTHPIDIERALDDDLDTDPVRRDLQLEAKAHIAVQEWIDADGIKGKATEQNSLMEIHQRFCENLPEDLLWIEDPGTQKREKVAPGKLRETDVKVGSHVGISPGTLARFMKRFEAGYASLGKFDSILAAASAHHRLLYMHPFLDGNGRVARLLSYAMLREALDTGEIWSIARGLARSEDQYKEHLANCDLGRRNDLGGHDNLSEEALAAFTKFFLKICIEQVDFMEELMQPERLRNRIVIWCEEEIRAGNLPVKSDRLMSLLVDRGELPRGDVSNLLGLSERASQRITKALLEARVISSPTTRMPLSLTFPATLAGRWMPNLYPDR